MKVTIIEPVRHGSRDGVLVEYAPGDTADVDKALAAKWIASGVAADPAAEKKSDEPSPTQG